MTLGERLWAIRKHMGVTQDDFAKAMGGCTREFISQIERGRSQPSAAVLAGLERAGFSGNWLMTGQGSMLSTKSTSDSESLSVADYPRSSLTQLLIDLPPEVGAGDTILVRIERREHPLALIGKIIYTIRGK